MKKYQPKEPKAEQSEKGNQTGGDVMKVLQSDVLEYLKKRML